MDDQRPSGAFEGRERPPQGDPGRLATVLLGLAVIAIGLWFFAERSLGLAMPRVDWDALWPLVVIGIGAWIALGARGRRA